MQLKKLFQDENAVSPVIGVILMVAITVILAAVIGTFVLGLGDQVSDSAPQASFTFDFEPNGGSAEQVIITHDGGDTIPRGRLSVSVGGTTAYDGDAGTRPQGSFSAPTDWSDPVQAGSSLVLQDGSDGSTGTSEIEDGEQVRVVWTSETGDDSSTLAKAESSVGG